ncbi:MAG: complex I subunit 4 family protein [Anaerolineae bacterium]
MSWANAGLVGVLVIPIVAALILVLFRKRLVAVGHWVAGIATFLSLALVFAAIPALQRGAQPAVELTWIPAASVGLRLYLDWLALPFLLTEAAVTFLSVIYAWGYHHRDARTPIFYALLLLFSAGMAGTTLADDLLLFYTFWELMLLASAALILIWGDEKPEGPTREAVTLKYFIFTHVGSLMVLVALLTLYNAAGSDSLTALRAGGWSLAPRLVGPIIALMMVGFSVKMAVFPVHLWLPDAHTVAPMPVTIMLAAAMLSMGTYGILRFPFSLFSVEEVGRFALPMMIVGLVSEVYGALIALVEKDLKRIIAYSSVSQMGYILFGLGTLTRQGITGATLHVLYHAIVKALLFMVVGLITRGTGKRDIDELGGLGRKMPFTTACAVVGALAIAGVPPFCIFDSEWMIFSGGFHTVHISLSVVTLFGSLFTVAYIARFAGRLFLGESAPDLKVEKPSLAMLAPSALLAVFAIVEGLFPGPVFDWVTKELPLLFGGQW